MSDEKLAPAYDVVEWAVSMRWLLLMLLLLSFLVTAIIWIKRPPPSLTYITTIQIYPGGSWVRNSGDIAAILWMKVQSSDIYLLSELSANPVIISSPSKAIADQIAQAAENLATELIGEANDLFVSAFSSGVPSSALTVRQFKLEAQLFLGGVDRGIVDLIKPVVSVSRLDRGVIPYMFVPPLVAIIAFLLFGTAITFFKRVRR